MSQNSAKFEFLATKTPIQGDRRSCSISRDNFSVFLPWVLVMFLDLNYSFHFMHCPRDYLNVEKTAFQNSKHELFLKQF